MSGNVAFSRAYVRSSYQPTRTPVVDRALVAPKAPPMGAVESQKKAEPEPDDVATKSALPASRRRAKPDLSAFVERERRFYPAPVPAGKWCAGRKVQEGEIVYVPKGLLRLVSETTGVTMTDLLSDSRVAEVSKARLIYYWLARHHSLASMPVIALVCGGRDHTSVLSGVRRVEAVIRAQSLELSGDLTAVTERLWSAVWPRACDIASVASGGGQ